MSVKHSLLALLAAAPASASALQHGYAEETGSTLNIGQVAQTLTRLERDELIAQSGATTGPTGRKADQYAITEEGRAELHRWFTAPVLPPAADRDELVIKVALAARRPEIDLVSLLDNQRFATLQAVRELTAAQRDMPQVRSAHRLASEKRIFELEATLRWLDRVEALAPLSTNAQENENR